MGTTGKPTRNSAGTARVVSGKIGHRRGMKCAASKRVNSRASAIGSKKENVEAVATVDACDNSNDSGLGFDHHIDYICQRSSYISPIFSDSEFWEEGQMQEKRKRLDIKVESDDANDNFTFSRESTSSSQICLPVPGKVNSSKSVNTSGGKGNKRNQAGNSGQSIVVSRFSKAQLEILSQPEMQHRARYQTEGSRGAVKDRTGSGFPVVKLSGYDGSATLEVYIGTDQGRVAPHMFYQACKVSGKNSTPCIEQKVNGTVIIQIEFDESKDMVVTCDCVGILKERNVDVEHRFPEESSNRNKKKSTRCRMVFRTTLTHKDGITETLLLTSQPIVCTQPPGVPEICKKSLSACPVTGGFELFIFGKNFLKDTHVVFSEGERGSEGYWQDAVQPDKDFLQQSHLVCVIPPYKKTDVKSGVQVNLQVISGGKSSEPHSFIYLPIGSTPLQAVSTDLSSMNRGLSDNFSGSIILSAPGPLLGVPLVMSQVPCTPSQKESDKINHVIKNWTDTEIMPAPKVNIRSDLRSPSFGSLSQFALEPSLPSLSVDTYLSKIESKLNSENVKKSVDPPFCNLLLPTIGSDIKMNLVNDTPTKFKIGGATETSGEDQIQSEQQMSPQFSVQTSSSSESSSKRVIIDVNLSSEFSPQVRPSTIAEGTTAQTDLLLRAVDQFSPSSEISSSTKTSGSGFMLRAMNELPPASESNALITEKRISNTSDINDSQGLLLGTTDEFPTNTEANVPIGGGLILGSADQFPPTTTCPPKVVDEQLLLGQFSASTNSGSSSSVSNDAGLMLSTVNHYSPSVAQNGNTSSGNQGDLMMSVNHYSASASSDKIVQAVMIDGVSQYSDSSMSHFSSQPACEGNQEVFSPHQAMLLPIQPQFQPQPTLNISTYAHQPSQSSQQVMEPQDKDAKPIQRNYIDPSVLEFNTFDTQSTRINPSASTKGEYHNIVMAGEGIQILGSKSIDQAEQSKSIPQETKQETMPHTHDFTQMSDHDLISYINPSCFDQV